MAESAIKYLKRLVFPYLTHEEKMFTGKFFYEAEMMEKEQIKEAYILPLSSEYWFKDEDFFQTEAEKYYNETYGK
jgi:hypothetical protein